MSAGNTKVKLNEESVLAYMQDFGEVLSEYERKHISVLIDVVRANQAWHRSREDSKAEKRMQTSRETAGRVYTDMERRMHLIQKIYDMIG